MNESFETVATVIGERVAIIGSRPERVEGRLTEASWARRARVFSYVESLARRSKSTVIVAGSLYLVGAIRALLVHDPGLEPDPA